MALLNVNPTRMQLKNLKSRLVIASKGHKLLKDKLDELVRQYTIYVKDFAFMQNKVQKKFLLVLEDFNYAKGYMSDKETLQEFVLQTDQLECEYSTESIMNLPVPKVKIKDNSHVGLPYAYASTNIMFDVVSKDMNEVMQDLIKLSELGKTCDILSCEIEKTKRRVNALEQIVIPNLTQTINYVSMKIDENDRSFIIRLTKSKTFK